MGLEVSVAGSSALWWLLPPAAPTIQAARDVRETKEPCLPVGFPLYLPPRWGQDSEPAAQLTLTAQRNRAGIYFPLFFKTQEEANVSGFPTISGVTSLWNEDTVPTISPQSQTGCEQGLDATDFETARWVLRTYFAA